MGKKTHKPRPKIREIKSFIPKAGGAKPAGLKIVGAAGDDTAAPAATVGPAPEVVRPAAPDPMEVVSDNIARWRVAPWVFVEEVFGANPDPWQNEALHALVGVDLFGAPLEKTFEMFCMKACKGPGKSCLLAWVIWWFLTCFEFPKVLCTSITAENLRDNLWSELALWRGKSEILQGLFEHEGERIYAKGYKETWFAAARTWPKEADKTKQADTLAGHHAKNTMIVLDEAGGIPVAVLAAGLAHHSTQGNADEREVHLTFMAGNPTNLDSALGWACTENAAHWWVKEITGDPKDPKRAPRIDPKWAQKQIDDFGEENAWVLVNVFGKFPPIQANKLLGPDIVRAAMSLVIEERLWRGAPRIMSLDVARSVASDRSALARREGRTVFPFRVWRLDNLMQLAAQVVFEFSRWPADVIFVDMLGLGGGVLDRLLELRMPAVGVNCGLPSADPRFADKRTEMWWNGAQEIKGKDGKGGIALPNDNALVPDLTGPVIEWSDKGKMKLISKEKMKRLGMESPDLGDALMQTWAEPMSFATDIPESFKRALARSNKTSMCKTEWDPFEGATEEEIDA